MNVYDVVHWRWNDTMSQLLERYVDQRLYHRRMAWYEAELHRMQGSFGYLSNLWIGLNERERDYMRLIDLARPGEESDRPATMRHIYFGIHDVVSFENASLLSRASLDERGVARLGGLMVRACHSCDGWEWDVHSLNRLDVIQCPLCKEFNST